MKTLFLIQMQLDLSKGHIKALREADLGKDSGIEACTSAADALQQAMEVELPIGLELQKLCWMNCLCYVYIYNKHMKALLKT